MGFFYRSSAFRVAMTALYMGSMAVSLFALDPATYPIKAIYIPNANLLSRTFLNRYPQASIDKLLVRAKEAGYTHLIVNIEVQMASEGTDGAGDEFVFYPHARKSDEWPGGKYHQYKEAFEKAAASGFLLIPHIEMATSRCGRTNNPGTGWDDLHPATISGIPCDPDTLPSNVVLNRYGSFASTPFADDGPQGFVEHLRELYATIKREYDAAEPRPASIPYINLSFDENRAPALDHETGAPWFVKVKGNQYLNLVLLLGQNNLSDQAFLSAIIDRERTQGRALDTAVKIAVSTLYAYRIEQEARAIEKMFGSSTGLMIGGYMFDPEGAGNEPFITAYHATDRFLSLTGPSGVPDVRNNVRVRLAANDGFDPLDLPGTQDPAYIRAKTVLVPWWYFTHRTVQIDGSQPDYDPKKIFDYFTKKGFRFAFMSTLTSFDNETAPRAATVDMMRKAMNALGSPAYAGKAAGFVAAWWPCFSHRHGEGGSHALGDSSCRCGPFNYNLHWHDGADRYDQPFEYNTIEYLMWYARGKTSVPPEPGATGLMNWFKRVFSP